jgi:hypothetical protein
MLGKSLFGDDHVVPPRRHVIDPIDGIALIRR